MKFIWAEKRRKTALPPPKNTNNSLTPPLWAINNKDMKSNEQLRKEFEEQTGNKAIVFPACHGETGYASWEYQLWLEQKLLEEYAQQFRSPDMAEALRLLDTASNLVGNPGTNISSSTDLACDSWQEKYKKFIASLSPGVEDGSGWVSLVDKLPDYGTIDVWVSEYHHKGRMPNVEYRKRDFHNKSDRFEAYMHTDSGMQWVDITNMVTHWRPLPAPPGVEDNQTKKQ